MEFVTEDEPDLSLPEGSVHRARLEEIKLRTFNWTDKAGVDQEGKTLEWWWEITQTSLGEDYVGRKVKGECPPKITNRGDNLFRSWSEALLNRHIPVGMAIDTDDLIGLEAEILIGHKPNKKNPDRPWEQVFQVAPIFGGDQSGAEPPF